MPKNTGMGGNKRKKGKKPQQQEDRELQYKGESEEYAQVIKILGDGRFECNCADGVKRIAHVRGKMRKRLAFLLHRAILVGVKRSEMNPEKALSGITGQKGECSYEITECKGSGEAV